MARVRSSRLELFCGGATGISFPKLTMSRRRRVQLTPRTSKSEIRAVLPCVPETFYSALSGGGTSIVIGTGQAGRSLAARLAAAGRKTAIIERKLFGGTCVNTDCIPSETMVASAYAARMVRRAAEFGPDRRTGNSRYESGEGPQRCGVGPIA